MRNTIESIVIELRLMTKQTEMFTKQKESWDRRLNNAKSRVEYLKSKIAEAAEAVLPAAAKGVMSAAHKDEKQNKVQKRRINDKLPVEKGKRGPKGKNKELAKSA